MSSLPHSLLLSRIRFREAGTLPGLILIGGVFAVQSDTFLTTRNLINILQQVVDQRLHRPWHDAGHHFGRDRPVGRAGRAAVRRAGTSMLVEGVPVPLAVLGTLRSGLTLMNVQAFCQLLATRIIIIVAMLIDKLTSARQG